MAKALRFLHGAPTSHDIAAEFERAEALDDVGHALADFDTFLADVLTDRVPRAMLSDLVAPDSEPSEVVRVWRLDNLEQLEAMIRNSDRVRTFKEYVETRNLQLVAADARSLMSDLAHEINDAG